MKVLVLGAAGAMARVAVRDMLDSDGVERIGLADLSFDTLKSETSKLADDRLEPLRADVRDAQGMTSLMSRWDAVINSTWYELNLDVMRSAIRAGIDYLDLGGLYHMTLKQLELHASAKDAGVTCLLGMGSSPGITNVMAMYGAKKLDKVDRVKIRSAGGSQRPVPGFSPPYSFRTILDEWTMPAVIVRQGRLMEVPALSESETFVLPDPVGEVEGYYTIHSELATLPKNIGKGLSDMDFIVGFSPEFSRSVTTIVRLGLASRKAVTIGGVDIKPYEVVAKVVDSLPKQGKNSFDVGIRRVELFGKQNGHDVHLIYDCVSRPSRKWKIGGRASGTGVPASIGAQWLAQGKIKSKGVIPPELAIDAEQFFRELNARERDIKTYESGDGQRALF